MKHFTPGFKKELQRLYGTKSTIKAAIAITINWLALALCMVSITSAIANLPLFAAGLVYTPLSFIAGCCLRGFDNLTHEASHNNIFRSKALHRFLQFLFAFPVLKTIEDYGPGHWMHHRNYRKHKNDDPDTQQNIRWGVETLPSKKTSRQILWFYVARVLLLYYVYDNIRYNLMPHLLSKNAILGRILFWIAVLSLLTLTNGWFYFLMAYVIPCFFWLPYIRFITESSKHTNVNLESEFANSRNNIGWLHQVLLHPHNDGFHQMHHYMATIPFYNLKKAYIYAKTAGGMAGEVIESSSMLQTIKQSLKTY